jgi:hypothetical protein
MRRSDFTKLAQSTIGSRVTVWDSPQKDGIGATTSEWGRGVIIYYPDRKIRERAMMAALTSIAHDLATAKKRKR